MKHPEKNEAARVAPLTASMNPTNYERASAMNMIANADDFNSPVIAGVEITTDAQGRFNLNALHKASGQGASKAPNQWLRLDQAKELIAELEAQTAESQFGVLNVMRGGNAPGTFAAEELAVSYAGWISPSFQLEVNRTFIAHRKGELKPVGFQVPKSFGEALRLAADQAEQIEAMKPMVIAMERLGASEGSVLPRIAAKALDMPEKKFFKWLHSHNWAFRQGKTWQAYSEKMKQGYLEHDTRTFIVEETGQERTKVQLLVTPKGMARLAQIFSKGGAA